jgi:hypothetical protein
MSDCDWLKDNMLASLLYDIFKFLVAYFLSGVLWHRCIKAWWYRGWVLIVMNDGIELARRKITPTWAGKIFNDEYDFSIYVKSFVSPYFYLNLDVASDEAKTGGLTTIDKTARKIIIDQAKNPPKTS